MDDVDLRDRLTAIIGDDPSPEFVTSLRTRLTSETAGASGEQRDAHEMAIVEDRDLRDARFMSPRNWWIGGVAAAAMLVAFAGMTMRAGDEVTDPVDTVADQPDSTTVGIDPVDQATIDVFFAAYNAAQIDQVLAMLAPNVIMTDAYGSGAPNPNNGPIEDVDQLIAWKLAQGEIITEPTCSLADEQTAQGTTLSCRYTTLDALVQATGETPIPTRTNFTIVDGAITEIHNGYSSPDFTTLTAPFNRWLEQTHPEIAGNDLLEWNSREEAAERGTAFAERAEEWAQFLDETGCSPRTLACTPEDDNDSASEPPAVVALPPLPAPTSGETQQTIIGDITWTLLEGDTGNIPDVGFESDGTFYGTTDVGTTWWSSTDGIEWIGVDSVDPESGLPIGVDSGDPEHQLPSGVDLPPSDSPPGDGLVSRSTGARVVAELNSEWLVVRGESFGVPWESLLGVEAPFVVEGLKPSWSSTFEIHEALCDGFECEPTEQAWTIRPEVVDGDPARIDFYDDNTGALITSVTPPPDGDPIEDVLNGLAIENYGRGRTEHILVTQGDARILTNTRPDDLAGFTRFDERVFALGSLPGRSLWATSDLETWEQLPLELPSSIAAWCCHLESDGTTMMITPFEGRTTWATTDAETWWTFDLPLLMEGHDFGATEFGWFLNGTLDEPDSGPALAVSPDGSSWQVIPIPEPRRLVDDGLTWADDGLFGIEAYAQVHGTTIFVTLDDDEDDNNSHWVGRVDTG